MAHTHPLLEAVFPRRRQTLGDQLTTLSQDVTDLLRQVRKQAAPRVHDAAQGASDLAGDVLHQIEPFAREVAHRAKSAGLAVRNDPVPAVVALGTFALIASLLISGGGSRR